MGAPSAISGMLIQMDVVKQAMNADASKAPRYSRENYSRSVQVTFGTRRRAQQQYELRLFVSSKCKAYEHAQRLYTQKLLKKNEQIEEHLRQSQTTYDAKYFTTARQRRIKTRICYI